MAFKVMKIRIYESENNTETPIESTTIFQKNWRATIREILAKYKGKDLHLMPMWFMQDGEVGWAALSNLEAELRG